MPSFVAFVCCVYMPMYFVTCCFAMVLCCICCNMKKAGNRPGRNTRNAKIVFYYQAGGGGRTRTYEGVSQRIYSPPPLPLGTLPRRRTSHPSRVHVPAGRGYGERLAWCQPRQ